MALRANLLPIQFQPNTPNSYLGWDASGNSSVLGVFGGATVSVAGTVGLVKAPAAGEQLLFLRGDGIWAAAGGGGGSGTITGTGVAGRVPIWSSVTDLTNNINFTWDNTNFILKSPTINVTRTALPGDTTAGNFLYDQATLDFRGRVDTMWTNFTKQDEIVLPAGTTTYILGESDRNKFIRTTATTTVTISLTALSNKFSTTIVKGGTGDVVFTGAASFSSIGSANTIFTQEGAVTVYHAGSNAWRGYGALGTAGAGTITTVGLTAPTFLTVTGSPLTGTGGVISMTLAVQAAETVFMGPAIGGAAATPTFRPMTVDSLPLISWVDYTTAGDFTVNLTTHRARIIDVLSSGAHIITLPNTGVPDGWWCNIWRGSASGNVSFTSSLTIQAEALNLASANTMATVSYKASGNKWIIVGKLS